MTLEKIPFFSGCIESIANGAPIEEKQTQEIYDKIKVYKDIYLKKYIYINYINIYLYIKKKFYQKYI